MLQLSLSASVCTAISSTWLLAGRQHHAARWCAHSRCLQCSDLKSPGWIPTCSITWCIGSLLSHIGIWWLACRNWPRVLLEKLVRLISHCTRPWPVYTSFLSLSRGPYLHTPLSTETQQHSAVAAAFLQSCTACLSMRPEERAHTPTMTLVLANSA